MGGVVLNFGLLGGEGTAALKAEAEAFGLDAVLRVADAAELAAAVSLDAKVVCMGDCSIPQALELLDAVPEGVLTVSDVRGAWKVRDAGYDALLLNDAMTSVCVR